MLPTQPTILLDDSQLATLVYMATLAYMAEFLYQKESLNKEEIGELCEKRKIEHAKLGHPSEAAPRAATYFFKLKF